MSIDIHSIDIHSTYDLTAEQISAFERDGFIKLANVLSPETLRYYGEEITR